MEVLLTETSVKVLVLNVTVGDVPEGSKPDPRIVIWVNLLLTEALLITTVVAAAGRLLTRSNATRQSGAHLGVTF